MNTNREKLERIKDMPAIKKEIISYLFDYVARKGYGRWWQYKGEFKYEGKEYLLEAQVMFDNQMFTYRNLHIEHKQVVIDLTSEETYDEELVRGMMQ